MGLLLAIVKLIVTNFVQGRRGQPEILSVLEGVDNHHSLRPTRSRRRPHAHVKSVIVGAVALREFRLWGIVNVRHGEGIK